MRVALKPGWERTYKAIWPTNSYHVIAIEDGYYRIIDDKGGPPVLYNSKAFAIVDSSVPADWETTGGTQFPRELLEPRCLFDLLHDRNETAIRKFAGYMQRIVNERVYPDCNEFRMLVAGEGAVFLELAPDGVEVRRVNVYSGARYGYADANEGVGGTALVETSTHDPRSPDRENGNAISRAEFEIQWERAVDAHL